MNWNTKNDNYIASLDPLKADHLMKQVPFLNKAGEVQELSKRLKVLCTGLDIVTFDELERQAIVRDLGILLGSIKRHGAEPISLVPEVESILMQAADLADLPARDILLHYTLWNPSDHRQRLYTDHPQETALIESMRIAIPQVREACRMLVNLKSLDFHSHEAVELALKIDIALKSFLEGLKFSKERVDPDVFIKVFRPYFEPITVNKQVLNGPGAVTMPLHIFDYILWGCSEQESIVHDFTAHYAPYNMPEFRSYYREIIDRPSILDLLAECFHKTDSPETLYPLISVIDKWFRRLSGFRKSHLKYANAAYHGPVKHPFKTGSGGHPTSDLVTIAILTLYHEERVKGLLKMIPIAQPFSD